MLAYPLPASPQAETMPTIQVGDVVITDSTILHHRAMVITNKLPHRLSRGTTERVRAIYRDPLWRRPPQAETTKGDK